MIEQRDVNHAHNDRIRKMAQFEELTRELQDYAYCLGYNRCMDVNDALRAENTILREALEEIERLTRSHVGPHTRAAMIHGVCCKALQQAGGGE